MPGQLNSSPPNNSIIPPATQMIRSLSRLFLLCSIAALLATGCATRAKLDWPSRIGSYTFDDSVLELGPPDKSAVVSDGTKIAEWLVRRTSQPGHIMVTGHGRYGGPTIGTAYGPTQTEWFIRLIFDPNGVLKEYKEISK